MDMLKVKNDFSDEMAQEHIVKEVALMARTTQIVESEKNFKKVLFTN